MTPCLAMIVRRLSTSLLVILVILLAANQTLALRWNGNVAALITMRSLRAGDLAALHSAERTLTSSGDVCGSSWLLGLVYNSLGDLGRRDKTWETALHCSPAYIQLVRAMAHDNISLAELAAHEHPEQADAWFWLAELKLKDSPEQAINFYWQGLQRQPHNSSAWVQLGRALASMDIQVALNIYDQLELDQLVTADPLLQPEPQFIMASILAKSQPERAIQLYRQGLQRKPYDGVRWYELGDLLSKTDPQAAIEAYLQSCYNGDPGNHGCYGAGLVAEEQGDIQSAIRYYRMSRWEGALQRAGRLEQTLP